MPQRFGIRSIILLILLAMLLVGCKPSVRTRPIGYLRLGAVADLLSPETKLSEMWLLLRNDLSGLSAMSTLCSYDLNEVKRVQTPELGDLLECDLCHSRFKLSGERLSGPAEGGLPYYGLQVDSLEVGGPKDTLYARIGVEVSPQWRLRVHLVE